MTLRIATTFRIPAALDRLAGMAGIRVLSQSGLRPAELDRYMSVDVGVWAEAQVAARRAFVAVRDSEATPVPAACQAMGLDERYGRDALAQWVSQETLFRLNFVHVCRHAFPDAVVVADFAPALRHALSREGFRFHATFSRLAWMVRRLGLVAEALAAHAAHFVLRVRDEMRPNILGLAPETPVLLWPGVYDGELNASEKAINVSDFVASRPDFFPPGETVVCEGNPARRHAAPVTVVRRMFSLRRTGRSGVGATVRDLALQLRLAWAAATGGWTEAMMGRECAKLPRARTCLADLRPRAIYGTIALLQYLSFWFAPARQAGAPLRIFCTSTQVFPVLEQACRIVSVVPDIYMLMSADEYLVWDEAHMADLMATGVRRESIRVIGPVVLSTPAPDIGPADPERIIVDYFDQPPCSRAKLLRMGAPAVFHTPERLIATLEELVAVLNATFSGQDWLLRLKSKRQLSDQEDGRYAQCIGDLERRCPNLKLVDPSTSPLALHADATATIGFPFVSPVVSAFATGGRAAFYDHSGVAHEPGCSRNIPVLRNRAALAGWLAELAGATAERSAGARLPGCAN